MRKLIIALSTCALLGATTAYAAEAQLGTSTQLDSNTDLKSQDLKVDSSSDIKANSEAKKSHTPVHHAKPHKKSSSTDGLTKKNNSATTDINIDSDSKSPDSTTSH